MSEVFDDALSRRRAQVEEYSQYVAAEIIRNATGAAVYGRGYPVPAGNVEPDGSIILLRHACPGKDPVTGDDCSIPHNEVLERSDPGMAVKANTTKKQTSAKKDEAK